MNYTKIFFSNDHITLCSIIFLFTILICIYIIIFDSIPNSNINIIKDLEKECLIKCEHNICKYITNSSRGNNYYINDENSNPTDCIFTFWEASHLIMHIFIGYFFNLYYVLGIGIPFEIYEYVHYKCENYLDIVYNVIGGVIGCYLRVYL
jgi:hypothetical protein